MATLDPETGVILVDHGSQFQAANDMLADVARMFAETSGVSIVEAAHMELAEPTVAQAFAACVARGAKRIVIHPYFLSPGRHSITDIPRLSAEAAQPYPDVPFHVSEPLGLDGRLIEVALHRVREVLRRFGGQTP